MAGMALGISSQVTECLWPDFGVKVARQGRGRTCAAVALTPESGRPTIDIASPPGLAYPPPLPFSGKPSLPLPNEAHHAAGGVPIDECERSERLKGLPASTSLFRAASSRVTPSAPRALPPGELSFSSPTHHRCLIGLPSPSPRDHREGVPLSKGPADCSPTTGMKPGISRRARRTHLVAKPFQWTAILVCSGHHNEHLDDKPHAWNLSRVVARQSGGAAPPGVVTSSLASFDGTRLQLRTPGSVVSVSPTPGPVFWRGSGEVTPEGPDAGRTLGAQQEGAARPAPT